ncbi:MAG: S-layer homology domain-containing protein [Candidatus Abawacabacteria bacterium]|nr:S-layer homology domain-containing protein [Candidatus Abawacabacteria bacterium]
MKKFFLAIVAVLLVFSAFPHVRAADFPDVPSSHPNYTAVNFLRDRGVINGYEDGTYKPNRSVTRAEFLKIILLSSGHSVQAGDLDRGAFSDVPMSAWYFGYINRGLALGVISGYPDGLFRPDQTVNRVEALKIMLRANNIVEASLPTSGSNYADISAGVWYEPYARFAMAAHLFDGAQLRPSEMMNRGQVAEMVHRFYLYRPDLLPSSPIPSPTPTTTITPTPSATTSPLPTPIAPTSSATPTPTVTASSSFRVNSASMLAPSPANYMGPCPAWSPISFVGIVNTNGLAGNIAYRWERIGGGHVTNFEVLGIPAGQSSVSLHWNPNWDTSVHTAYRLHVLNNADGSNMADSGYEGFAIDCTSSGASPSPTPTPTPTSSSTTLNVTAIGLGYSGTASYSATCPSTLAFNFKGSVTTNGQAGTIRYYVEDETGNRSTEGTYTFSAGITSSPILGNRLEYTNTSTDWVRYVRRFVITPDGQTHNSGPIHIVSQCASSHAPAAHRVDRAFFTANQPSWGTRWVCGRDNTYNLAGRAYLVQPAAGGDVTYRWIFNTGVSTTPATVTYTPGSTPYVLLPVYDWVIPRDAPEGAYTAWLEITAPNVIRSESVTITKPRCFSL